MKALFVALFVALAGCAYDVTTVDNTIDLARAQVLKLSLAQGNGSGVVIRPGLVLTAKHVAVYDGLTTQDAGAKGVRVAAAPSETVDLGLIYYPTRDAHCPCVRIADYEAERNETVYVIGFPLGVTQVVTTGRSEGVLEHIWFPSMFGPMDIGRRLVLTVPAQHGNSGGGAFVFRNGELQLVGIVVSATATPGGSLTFAIPLVDIKQFLAENA